MSQPDPITNVTAAYGQADQNWDVYFTPLQQSYADAIEDMGFISIFIDETTGEVTLNAGYAPGSPQFKSESSLFAEYEAAIVEVLVKEVPSDQPTYKAFLDAAAADLESRHEQLAAVARSLHEHDLELLEDGEDDDDADHLSAGTHARIAAGRERFFR